MSNKFRVTWEADDGYAGGSAPQRFSISADDVPDDMDDEELRKWFWESVQEDFEQRVSAISQDEDEFVAWAKEVLIEREKLQKEGV